MRQSIFILFCCIVFASKINAQEYTAQIGDTITVTVREREWLSGTQAVDANGQITLPTPIGSVKVVGLTATQITDLLTERLKETIVEPTVFVLISPASRLTVHITGEVQTPNSFEVAAGSSLQAAITRAGGFTTLADKKQIKLIRKDPKQVDTVSELVIDFTKFQENAEQSSNPPLKAFDVVIVPRLPKSERSVIMVIGAVNQPGAISIEEPLFLVEALVRAGGPSTTADLKQISILRPEGDKYVREQLNLEDFLTRADLSANPIVSSGEVVFVPTAQPRQDTVNVIGAVTRPGAYPLYKGGRLLDVIYAAGGFADGAAVNKVTIIRPSNPGSPKIEVDVTSYLRTSDLKYNPLLEIGDAVFIPIQEDVTKSVSGVQTAFVESMRVTIIGEVKIPDTYQVSKASTVLDVLNLAGGPTLGADLKRVTIIRENVQMQVNLEKVLQEGKLQSLPPVQENDTIRVPRIKQEVSAVRGILSIARDAASIISVFLLVSGKLK